MFLGVIMDDFLRRQEVRDELRGLSGPLQRHRVTAVLQHVHLTVWQRFLQHRCPGNVQHLMVDTTRQLENSRYLSQVSSLLGTGDIS